MPEKSNHKTLAPAGLLTDTVTDSCTMAEPDSGADAHAYPCDTTAYLIDDVYAEGEEHGTQDSKESKPQHIETENQYQTLICTTLVLSREQLERHFSGVTWHTSFEMGTGFSTAEDDADCLVEKLKQLPHHHPIVGFPSLEPHNPSSERLHTLLKGIQHGTIQQATLIAARLYEADRASPHLCLDNSPNTSERLEAASLPAGGTRDPPGSESILS
jgi:hypothetical protein